MSVAATIQGQIGHGAFVMMGAKILIDEGNGLQWKIGKNAKRVTHIRVTLDPSDTYTVEFIKAGRAPRFEIKTLASHSLVYFDQLRGIIEAETGLYLSL